MTTHEGWSNYPTWCINQWLANDKALHAEALGVVRTAIAIVKASDFDEPPEPVHDVADALKAWLEEFVPVLYDDEQGMHGIRSDLLTWAFAQVDWRELAESWIETCDELRKAETLTLKTLREGEGRTSEVVDNSDAPTIEHWESK